MECDRRNDAGQDMGELVATLYHLLEGQLAAGREGDLSRVEQLGEQANAVVAGIARNGGDLSAVLGTRGGDVKRLYDELILMLQAERSDVQGKLKKVRQVKRAAGAYRVDR